MKIRVMISNISVKKNRVAEHACNLTQCWGVLCDIIPGKMGLKVYLPKTGNQ